MSVKLLTEHHLEFLSLKGGCTGSPESTFVKMPHCCKSHVAAICCAFCCANKMLLLRAHNIIEPGHEISNSVAL